MVEKFPSKKDLED